jgi:putative flavoprotein involved in K+ transport
MNYCCNIVVGLDLHFWLEITGIYTFPFYRIGKEAPNPVSVFDLGGYREKLENGSPDQKQMFTSFYPEGVMFGRMGRGRPKTV